MTDYTAEERHAANLFDNAFDTKGYSNDNTSSSVFSWESLNTAFETMKSFIDSDNEVINIQPSYRIVPPELTLNEQKYWIPYGNIAVPVHEEIEYKFVHRVQGYLRNKWQNVSLPRLIVLSRI